MPKVIFDNYRGHTLEMVIGGIGSPYVITDIDGLAPPRADINMTDMALTDGRRYNSAKVDARVLNIAFAITYEAEKHRLEAYDVFRIKQPIKMQYTSERVDVWTEGYIQTIDLGHFDNVQIMTVSIICPFPYLRSAQLIVNELSSVVKAFHFPFAITAADPIPISYIQQESNVTVTNAGQIDTGFTMTLGAIGTVVNPKVLNYVTGEYFGLNMTMEAGDVVTINSTAGNKTVDLLRDGVHSNIFNSIMEDSTWLIFRPGENIFVYEADSGAEVLTIGFSHYDLYEGV